MRPDKAEESSGSDMVGTTESPDTRRRDPEAVMLGALSPALVVGALLASLAIPVGCSDEGRLGDRVASEQVWQIGLDPTLVIGALGSSPEESLYQPQGIAYLSDGRVAVADGGLGRSRVSVFSAGGHHLRTLGGTGDGPGEFRWVTSLRAGPDDSLYAFDAQLQRLTVFSADGLLARTASFRIPTSVVGSDGLFSVGRLSDGVWVGRGMESVSAAVPGEIRRDTVAVGLLDGGLRGFRPLEYLPGLMTTRIADGRFGAPPFTPRVLDAAWGRCVFVTATETPSISVYSSTGQLVVRFDGPGKPRPVTQQHLDSLLESRARDASEVTKSRVRQWIEESTHPDRLPYFNQMLVDEWGQLWLQVYEPPNGPGTRWLVISQSGRELGTAILPERIRVFAVSRVGVLLTRSGEFDEPRVELLPFTTLPMEMGEPLPECAAPS